MILIHHNDLDGRCSAAIVLRKHPDAEPLEMAHGDPVPWAKLKGQDVWLVDFTLQPFERMIKLQETAKSLVWIDHHKAALEEAEKADFVSNGLYLEGLAGCELCWYYCNNGAMMPRAVSLLGRFDVWDHVDKEVVPFQYGMLAAQRTEPTSQLWALLLDDKGFAVDKLVSVGHSVQSYAGKQAEEAAKICAFEVEFEGLRAIAINGAGQGSLAFESVFKPTRHDIMIRFAWEKTHWTVSLYSLNEDPDVSKICEQHGGGGHPGAGGFQCAELPFKLPAEDRTADDGGEQ